MFSSYIGDRSQQLAMKDE